MVRPVSPNSTACPKSRDRATCPSSRASRSRFSEAGSFLSSREFSWSAIRLRLGDEIDYWRRPENLSADQADESAHSRNCRPLATPATPAIGCGTPLAWPAPALEAEALEKVVDLRLGVHDPATGPGPVRDHRPVEPAVFECFEPALRGDFDEQPDQCVLEILRKVHHLRDHLGREVVE